MQDLAAARSMFVAETVHADLRDSPCAMTLLHTLAVVEIARRIRAGDLSPVAVVETLLARIEEVEPHIGAWVTVDAAGALAAARALEVEARVRAFRGPLHGVPLGLKDIFDVAGMLTTSGAAAFAHRRPEADAYAVARLRRAGAIVLGKTTTTEFAYSDPTQTRNPWNREHTPGGSSSGSAAAVAARMIPLALGSQTIGSTLRPAAYCGIVGLKATHGLISAAGVTPLAWSLDHVGIFARSVEDAALALSVLAGPGGEGRARAQAKAPAAEAAPGGARGVRPLRFGIPRSLFAGRANDQLTNHLNAVASAFARAGAVVDEAAMPPSTEDLHESGQLVLRVEAAAYHAAHFAAHADLYRPRIRALVGAGLTVPAVDYVGAQQVRRRFREEMEPIFERYDALLMPVAPSPAPKGLDSTGDPMLCAPWSFGGFPAIALPSGVSEDGLPLAIQVIAGAYAEDHLLDVARWCETRLHFTAAPPV